MQLTIAERRERYTRLFAGRFLEMDGTGVLILDQEFRIVEVSGMLCALLGIRKQEWLDRPLEEWYEEAGWRPYPVDRSLLAGRTFLNRSLVCGIGGKLSSFLIDGDLLRDPLTGEAAGAFILFRDVSHLVKFEEQLLRSDRLKTIGQIAAGTAHEIRNPLTAIKGFMQMLQHSVSRRDMVKEQEYIDIVLSEIDRVNELVSEFLLLGKPREVKLAAVRAAAVVQEMLPVIRNEATFQGVTIRYHPQHEWPPVLVDKELLKQVLLNLAKNAIEAMGDGGTLAFSERVSADKPGWLALAVRDTGPGIPAEVLDRIFDPFYTTKPQGTGLGLSICQRIVHDFGGYLEVDSGPDGTVMTVWLPTAPK